MIKINDTVELLPDPNQFKGPGSIEIKPGTIGRVISIEENGLAIVAIHGNSLFWKVSNLKIADDFRQKLENLVTALDRSRWQSSDWNAELDAAREYLKRNPK